MGEIVSGWGCSGGREEIPVPATLEEAVAVQEELRQWVRLDPLGRNVRYIAGADAAYDRDTVFGAAVLMDFPGLRRIGSAVVKEPVRFPYLPGLLAFREGPVLLRAVAGLGTRPDFVIFNGHGFAHPRRIGLASHLGVLLDLPVFGVADRPMIGVVGAPGPERGSTSSLRDGDEVIGMAVRTKEGVRPVYVSAGHRIDLATSVKFALSTACSYRIPEPLRQAHLLSRAASRGQSG
ncbi:MAG: endonuclease V [Methanoregulaceae archaeon]|nr:endonuclease V [Methanoregulaceae archaeon]